MKGKHGRFGLTGIAIVVASAAFVVPTAQALHAPGDTAAPPRSPLATDDRLGPKYVEIARPAPSRQRTIEVVRPSGFRWDDTLIAAGATALAIASVGAATLAVTRRRRAGSVPAGLSVEAAPKERLG